MAVTVKDFRALLLELREQGDEASSDIIELQPLLAVTRVFPLAFFDGSLTDDEVTGTFYREYLKLVEEFIDYDTDPDLAQLSSRYSNRFELPIDTSNLEKVYLLSMLATGKTLGEMDRLDAIVSEILETLPREFLMEKGNRLLFLLTAFKILLTGQASPLPKVLDGLAQTAGPFSGALVKTKIAYFLAIEGLVESGKTDLFIEACKFLKKRIFALNTKNEIERQSVYHLAGLTSWPYEILGRPSEEQMQKWFRQTKEQHSNLSLQTSEGRSTFINSFVKTAMTWARESLEALPQKMEEEKRRRQVVRDQINAQKFPDSMSRKD